jgi:uncharacterized protein
MRTAPPDGPLGDAELARLSDLLAALPDPLQPLDPTSLDGYLCGLLLRRDAVPPARWLPWVLDVEGRAGAGAAATAAIAALVERRRDELDRAIERRAWFDPWIYAGDDDADPRLAMRPWVAGLSMALEHFPALDDPDDAEAIEALALLYAAFDADELEEAEALRAAIDATLPPSTLTEAAEDIVRAVLLLADLTRPRRAKPPRRR